ncbi:phosphomannomutase [Pararhizobium haloflavum]|uniref:phosphomannomutase n=1 Tax=Pararhizobium haloflavum TaxID=2037914 RepID=UPI000C1768F3|nr:phosphomannomutase [Pararhizobium haloflavum]
MDIKFGTSGLRGLAADLLAGAALAHAEGFGRHLLSTGQARAGDRVYVGRDLRESSPAIAADVWRGLAAAGLVPADCDALPTPALAQYALSRRAASIMVTGSHIPADRNGLKFYRPDGEIDKEDEVGIAKAAAEAAAKDAPMPEGIEDRHEAAIAAYLARYDGFMESDALRGLRIGIYEHSSVARGIVAQIVQQFGATVVPLGRSDDFVPIDTEAIDRETVAQFGRWAKDHRLDAILSTDGDGDRPLVADGSGQPLRGDALGLIAAMHLKADRVVTPVTSNSGIDEDRGFSVIRTRVGSPYVIAGMADALADGGQAVIGFEANGGLLTATAITRGETHLTALPTRDAVLPMLCVLAEAAGRGTPIAAVAADLRLPVAVSGRIQNYPGERSRTLVDALAGDHAWAGRFVADKAAIRRIDATDGVQLFFDDGAMIHFRPSGNAPEMRCYAEAPTRERAEALLARGLERIETYRPESVPQTAAR